VKKNPTRRSTLTAQAARKPLCEKKQYSYLYKKSLCRRGKTPSEAEQRFAASSLVVRMGRIYVASGPMALVAAPPYSANHRLSAPCTNQRQLESVEAFIDMLKSGGQYLI